MLTTRGRLLCAALSFNAPQHPALDALHRYLDSWRSMARQGYDLQLTRYDERGWRTTFYTTGMEPSPTSATGSAWEPTPSHAVQGAALDALWRSREAER